LIGVHPDYQNKAVTAVFSEYHTFKRGVENCFRTPELATQQFIIYGNISMKLTEEKLSG
jgi:hypothetical protein